MAFAKREFGNITVIARADPALVDCDAERYESYLEDLDESKLAMRPGEEPTRFVLRTKLGWDLVNKFKAQMIKVTARSGEDYNAEINVSVQYEQARAHLIDIVNPSSVPEDQRIVWKPDRQDGFTDKAIMEMLESYGIVNDLILALRHHSKNPRDAEVAKKN